MKKNFNLNVRLIYLLITLVGCTINAQTYVTVNGAGNENGTSWSNASTLENAITNASPNAEIWIKEGEYFINSTLICAAQSVSIYGGFLGNETSIDQRDWENNITTFNGQNSVKIMRFNSNNGVIDGINFINGYVTGSVEENNDGGGALRLASSNQIVRNCTFSNNTSTAERGAGAIFIWFGSGQLVENCVFNNNTHTYSEISNGGGAIHVWNTNVTIKNCQFNNNSSTSAGGAIYTWGNNLTIEKCIFEDNTSQNSGGAIHNNNNDFKVFNSVFKTNTSISNGGAINNNDTSHIVNCLFQENTTGNLGGAISNNEELYLTNSTFVSNNNTAIIYHTNNNDITHIFNSIFYNNTAADSKLKDVDAYTSNQDNSDKDFRYNIFEETTFGTNNLVGVDPLFLDFDTENFSLENNSPAHDFGDNSLYSQISATTPENSVDLANNPRLFGDNIDLGVYEIQEPVSIEKITVPTNQTHIYPNPTLDIIHITSKTDSFNQVSVYSPQGTLVLQKLLQNTKETSIDIASLPAGVYLLTISYETNDNTYRIVKK